MVRVHLGQPFLSVMEKVMRYLERFVILSLPLCVVGYCVFLLYAVCSESCTRFFIEWCSEGWGLSDSGYKQVKVWNEV